MIGVVLDGRLGNQMFQYAFAYNLGKKFKTPFFLSELRQKLFLSKYFKLNPFNRFINSFYLFFYSIVSKSFHKISFSNNDLPKENLKQLQNNSLFTGFFQSEDYFKENFSKIEEVFKVKEKYKKAFQSKYSQLFNNNKVIALHIRRTDYKNHGSEELGGTDLSLPLNYYKECLAQISNLENYKILFISDDIDSVKKEFGESSNFYFEKNEEIIDFQILLNADILCLANSSFSWWAAYLNKKKEKVFAPTYWLGFKVKKEYPKGILMPEWQKISVE